MKIVVAGLGYVGVANAVMLARHHDVTALDINAERVAMLNAGKSPIDDHEVSDWLANRPLRLVATTDPAAYAAADIVHQAAGAEFDPAEPANHYGADVREIALELLVALGGHLVSAQGLHHGHARGPGRLAVVGTATGLARGADQESRTVMAGVAVLSLGLGNESARSCFRIDPFQECEESGFLDLGLVRVHRVRAQHRVGDVRVAGHVLQSRARSEADAGSAVQGYY